MTSIPVLIPLRFVAVSRYSVYRDTGIGGPMHEIPLVPEVPESEDVFAKELEEVRRIASSIDHQLTGG